MNLKLTNIVLENELNNLLITAEDKQIDRLVYQLYELTDDEIKVVEGE